MSNKKPKIGSMIIGKSTMLLPISNTLLIRFSAESGEYKNLETFPKVNGFNSALDYIDTLHTKYNWTLI